jgi:ribosomal protein S18 acetylase RimI-like enzyme
MLDVTLRPATDQDSEFVYLVKKAALGPYIELTWGWDEEFQRRFHRDDYDPAGTQIVVESGRDVGWLLVDEDPAEFQLREIYVGPDYQGRGIGSLLIGRLLSQAALQSKPVKLQVLKVNLRARRLYEGLGFRVIEESDKHYIMRADPIR